MKTAFRMTAIAALVALAGFGAPAEAKEKKAKTPTPAAEAAKETTAASKVEPVDVNSADVKAIAAVPGVGDKLANEIVKGRPYKNAADLEKVKGIGKKKGAKLAPYFTFGEAKAAAESARPAAKAAPAAAAPAGAAAAAPKGSSASAEKKPALAPGEKVNINTASKDQLDRLPGIGPVKAQAILDYRARQRFETIEDVMKVSGIKEGEFAKIRDLITVR